MTEDDQPGGVSKVPPDDPPRGADCLPQDRTLAKAPAARDRGDATLTVGSVLQNTALLTVIVATPGALALLAYAIKNRLLPYLIDNVSTLQFISVSFVIGSVLVVGTVLSAVCWLSPLILRARFATTESLAHRLLAWLPPAHAERTLCLGASCFLLLLLLLVVMINSVSNQDHRTLWLVPFFGLAGLLLLGLLALHGPRGPIDWRLVLRMLPFGAAPILVVPLAIPPLLNLFMMITGFRTDQRDLLLVDEGAEQLLLAQAAFDANGLGQHPVVVQDRQMWCLPDGVVVWQGPGDRVLISANRDGDVVPVRRDQVMIPARRGAPVECR